MTDAAIHRVSRDADYWSLRFLIRSGSPRAFSPRDDKMGSGFLPISSTTHCLSLRGGSEAWDAAIHRVSRDTVDLSLRFLVHSGSPRAFSPRDDKILYAGATLAGMALLGCRPFGPGPPRSALLSASAVILPSLAHCFWKPTRKPM